MKLQITFFCNFTNNCVTFFDNCNGNVVTFFGNGNEFYNYFYYYFAHD